MERTDSRSALSSVPLLSTVVAALALVAGGAVAVRGQAPGVPEIIIDPRSPTERLGVPGCVPRAGDEASRVACRTVTEVLRRDLRFEGLFRFVEPSLMDALPAMDPESPNLADWQSVAATILVLTRAQVTGGELTVELKVIHVGSGQTMASRRFVGPADNPRIFAHRASDEVTALTQNRGVARTRIAFTSDRDATKEKRAKEVYIVDYDGYNPKRATANMFLNILPTWSPDGRSLAYTSYRTGVPDVFRSLIFEGRYINLTGGAGQSFAPSFSPDGKRIAYANSRSGNMEIWVVNADGGGARKLTSSPAADTAPSWSPTGAEIAFTSDRSGSPQIYVMDAEGLNVRRLTNVGNWNDAAAWNPSKEYAEIAYTARLEQGGFDIAVIDIGTRQVRQVTAGRGSCEYPSWAPSGRHLVFSCKRGQTWQITVANRDGSMIETLGAGPGNNVQPDWGPGTKD
jgi:TolB protein